MMHEHKIFKNENTEQKKEEKKNDKGQILETANAKIQQRNSATKKATNFD